VEYHFYIITRGISGDNNWNFFTKNVMVHFASY